MKNALDFFRILFVGTLSVLVVSCGGGGGGGGGVAFVAETPISITAANSDEVAAEAVSGAVGGEAEFALRPGSSQISQFDGLSRYIKKLSKLVQPQHVPGTASRTEPVICDNNGSGSITVPDNLLPSATSFNASGQFSNCLLSGDIVNGSFTMSITETSLTTVTIIMNSSNFSISNARFAVTLNGSVVLTETDGFDFFRTVTNGSAAVMTVTFNGRTITIGQLQETLDEYFNLAEDRFFISYVANSSALGGSFSVRTTQQIYQNFFDDYPYQGQIVITGENSSVRVTSQGSGSIFGSALVETDADGDGIYEVIETRTWQELENSLI